MQEPNEDLKFEIGVCVKCRITDKQGYIASRTYWDSGCFTYDIIKDITYFGDDAAETTMFAIDPCDMEMVLFDKETGITPMLYDIVDHDLEPKYNIYDIVSTSISSKKYSIIGYTIDMIGNITYIVRDIGNTTDRCRINEPDITCVHDVPKFKIYDLVTVFDKYTAIIVNIYHRENSIIYEVAKITDGIIDIDDIGTIYNYGMKHYDGPDITLPDYIKPEDDTLSDYRPGTYVKHIRTGDTYRIIAKRIFGNNFIVSYNFDVIEMKTLDTNTLDVMQFRYMFVSDEILRSDIRYLQLPKNLFSRCIVGKGQLKCKKRLPTSIEYATVLRSTYRISYGCKLTEHFNGGDDNGNISHIGNISDIEFELFDDTGTLSYTQPPVPLGSILYDTFTKRYGILYSVLYTTYSTSPVMYITYLDDENDINITENSSFIPIVRLSVVSTAVKTITEACKLIKEHKEEVSNEV